MTDTKGKNKFSGKIKAPAKGKTIPKAKAKPRTQNRPEKKPRTKPAIKTKCTGKTAGVKFKSPKHKTVNVNVKNTGKGGEEIDKQLMVIPPEPTQQDRALKDEQQVLRVEIMLLKGIKAKHQLLELLSIEDYRQLDRYIERVHARWEMEGTIYSLRRKRGEGLMRLDLMENELWVSLANTDDHRVKQVALRNLMDMQRLRNEMIGLKPAAMEAMDGPGAQGDETFDMKVAKQDKVRKLVSSMLGMMNEAVIAEAEDPKDSP